MMEKWFLNCSRTLHSSSHLLNYGRQHSLSTLPLNYFHYFSHLLYFCQILAKLSIVFQSWISFYLLNIPIDMSSKLSRSMDTHISRNTYPLPQIQKTLLHLKRRREKGEGKKEIFRCNKKKKKRERERERERYMHSYIQTDTQTDR